MTTGQNVPAGHASVIPSAESRGNASGQGPPPAGRSHGSPVGKTLLKSQAGNRQSPCPICPDIAFAFMLRATPRSLEALSRIWQTCTLFKGTCALLQTACVPRIASKKILPRDIIRMYKRFIYSPFLAVSPKERVSLSIGERSKFVHSRIE